ncbi:hypothetical protein SFA35_26125 (plasmid) [Pseudomonas sp. HR96]|uniref:hypothetical protein n=1 Tax=Pseudomonas sp. HR96 TaxID=1027966 RepID=UPI002A74ED2E|nr:hypothetical protein [Pseudomonas sp. HR96]WPP02522.1 hypothetical protein SFA35_26125 [Pseudomonas sp. HR96]
MLFKFLNIEETAQALVESSATFSAKYKSLGDAIQYLKQQSVALYEREYAEVEHAEYVADGVLHVPIWRDVGATYCALCAPNPPRGEEWPIKFVTPGAVYVEINFWASLPLS